MILFVCTGNTCRSPLAAALARARGIDAQSAGIFAHDGDPATPQAQRAAKRHGADLSAHQARAVRADMLKRAEWVYVMTPSHAQALRDAFPACADRVRVLWPPIPDPFGGDDGDYERCAQALLSAMKNAGIVTD